MIRFYQVAFLIYILIENNVGYIQVSSQPEAEDEVKDLKLDTTTQNTTNLIFTAFGKKFNLSLTPVNNIFSPDFKVYAANSLANGHSEIKELENTNKEEPLTGTFVSTPANGILYLHKNDNSFQLEGVVDDNTRLISGPMSHKLVTLSWNRIKDNSFTEDHVSINLTTTNISHHIQRRSIPEKVTIEVLVILDESTIENLRKTGKNIKTYLGIFWNCVQRRYSDISHPKINFVLVGAVRADSKLIKEATYKPGHLNGNKLLEDLTHWLYNHQKTLPKFDIAMLQTSIDLASEKEGQFHSNLLGRAYVGTVCHKDDQSRRMYNCGIGEDVAPMYSGVLTIAHEIAHLFGVPHDGTAESISCPNSEGYIMGHGRSGTNEWYFSSCSKQIIRNHLIYKANCVKDYSKPSISLVHLLPGQELTLNSVCQSWYGQDYKVYEQKTEDICKMIWCHSDKSTQVFTRGAPPEGSSCGPNMV